MRIISRILALILGLIGSAIGLLIDFSYSAFHHAIGMLGSATLDRTHGFIGFLLVVVGVIGSIMALFQPVVAVVFLLVAGIGLFFVVKGFALFSILFFLLAALFAWLGRHHHRADQPRAAGS